MCIAFDGLWNRSNVFCMFSVFKHVAGIQVFFFVWIIYYRVNVKRTVVTGLASQGSMKVNLRGEVCGLFIIYNISRNVVDPFQTE